MLERRGGHSECRPRSDVSVDPSTLFMENIVDVSKGIAEIIIVCGVHECKAKFAIKVILHAFLYYDSLRRSPDAKPWRTMCKKFLLKNLKCDCFMNDTEAELSYYIIKQAFKAYYFGVSNNMPSSPIYEAESILSNEAAWKNSSNRTAQIFNDYKHCFPSAHYNYNKEIHEIYKKLYNQLQARAADLILAYKCECASYQQEQMQMPNDTNDFVSDSGEQQDSSNAETKTCMQLLKDIYAQYAKNQKLATTRKKGWTKFTLYIPNYKCNKQHMVCNCLVDPSSGIAVGGVGKYKCKNAPMDNYEDDIGSQECSDFDDEDEYDERVQQQNKSRKQKYDSQSTDDCDISDDEESIDCRAVDMNDKIQQIIASAIHGKSKMKTCHKHPTPASKCCGAHGGYAPRIDQATCISKKKPKKEKDPCVCREPCPFLPETKPCPPPKRCRNMCQAEPALDCNEYFARLEREKNPPPKKTKKRKSKKRKNKKKQDNNTPL